MPDNKEKKEIDLSGFDEAVESAPSSGHEDQGEPISLGNAISSNMLQGMTANFGDEIAAGASALGDKVTGKETPFKELYNKYVALEREKIERAKKQHPVASTVSDLTGSFMSPMGIANKLGTAAKYGVAGVMGAIQGAGSSDASVMDNPIELAKDMGTGAALSMGLHGAGSAVAKGAKELELDKYAKDAYEYAKKGVKFLGEKGRTALGEETAAKLGNLIQSLRSEGERLASKENGIVQDATDSGKKIDISKSRQNMENSIQDSLETDISRKDKEKLLNKVKETFGDTEDGYQIASITKADEKVIPGQISAEEKLSADLDKIAAKDSVLGDLGEKVIFKKNINGKEYLVGGFRKAEATKDKFVPGKMIDDLKQPDTMVPAEMTDNLSNLKVMENTPAVQESVVQTPTQQQVIEKVAQGTRTEEMTPEQVFGLYKMLKDDPKSFKALVEKNPDIVKNFRDDLKQIPELDSLMKQLHTRMNAEEALGLKSPNKMDFIKSNEPLDVNSGVKELQGLVDKASQPGLLKGVGKQQFDGAMEKLEPVDLNKANELRSLQADYQRRLELNSAGGLQEPGLMNKAASVMSQPLKTVAVRGAHAAGKIVTSITDHTPEQLQQMANLIPAGFQSYKDELTKAALSPGGTRNAILFKLMQQKQFRQAIKSIKENNSDVDLSGFDNALED